MNVGPKSRKIRKRFTTGIVTWGTFTEMLKKIKTNLNLFKEPR